MGEGEEVMYQPCAARPPQDPGLPSHQRCWPCLEDRNSGRPQMSSKKWLTGYQAGPPDCCTLMKLLAPKPRQSPSGEPPPASHQCRLAEVAEAAPLAFLRWMDDSLAQVPLSALVRKDWLSCVTVLWSLGLSDGDPSLSKTDVLAGCWNVFLMVPVFLFVYECISDESFAVGCETWRTTRPSYQLDKSSSRLCVYGFWQHRVFHRLFVLESLGNPSRRCYRVHKRRLVHPGDSVCSLFLPKVYEGCPGWTLGPSRIHFVGALGRCHRLVKQFILCCWDSPSRIVILLSIQNGLVFDVLNCQGSWMKVKMCAVET